MTRVLYLGTVVSNGGDAAIQRAQMVTLDASLDAPTTAMHDSSPDVARRRFPGAEVLPGTYPLVHRPAGGSLPRRVLRRVNKERVTLAARLWRDGRGLGRFLVSAAEARQLASIASADLVAYTGGTSLIEKYSVRGKLYEVELALVLGRPVVLLPQSMGPFRDPQNVRALRRVLGRVDAVLLRDERSLGFLRDIGVRTDHVRVVPDIVFALHTAEASARLAAGVVPVRGARIGVSVRDCRVFFSGSAEVREQRDRAFRDAVAGLVTTLVRDHGADVTFVSTCQGVPEYWTDDSVVAQDVVARLPEDVAPSVRVDGGYYDTDGLLDAFGRFDLLVATRLHAAILALDAGTPVLPIAYEFKTQEVMAQLGMGDVVVTIEDATTESLTDALDRLLERLPAARAPLAAALEETGEQARRTGDVVRDALGARLTTTAAQPAHR
ncbi:polysaccharide pyruvyl transferase family protein [Actinotalea ferrariae]|uniref:polysaccharide pyruvyl transferase family protein n=1 Tax=Actinotalea ferrariae TaxID=1386098 RepID=UPI001C8B7691|nr:polysaccharide pyruvyl transferase family protein [Actinotalea ferrariae]MBX9244519.1 polysaccharide pyruvyl transferase family protein [Actinotalea ferrariae]